MMTRKWRGNSTHKAAAHAALQFFMLQSDIAMRRKWPNVSVGAFMQIHYILDSIVIATVVLNFHALNCNKIALAGDDNVKVTFTE